MLCFAGSRRPRIFVVRGGGGPFHGSRREPLSGPPNPVTTKVADMLDSFRNVLSPTGIRRPRMFVLRGGAGPFHGSRREPLSGPPNPVTTKVADMLDLIIRFVGSLLSSVRLNRFRSKGRLHALPHPKEPGRMDVQPK